MYFNFYICNPYSGAGCGLDSFACLKTENILFTRELLVSGYLCVFFTDCSVSTSTSVMSSLLFWSSGFSLWGDPGGVVMMVEQFLLSSFSLGVTSMIGSGMSAATSVTSIVSVTLISSDNCLF